VVDGWSVINNTFDNVDTWATGLGSVYLSSCIPNFDKSGRPETTGHPVAGTQVHSNVAVTSNVFLRNHGVGRGPVVNLDAVENITIANNYVVDDSSSGDFAVSSSTGLTESDNHCVDSSGLARKCIFSHQ